MDCIHPEKPATSRGLEKSWNGYLLSTVDTVLNRAGNFVWKGMRTVARLLDGVYEKGVSVCSDEKPVNPCTRHTFWHVRVPKRAAFRGLQCLRRPSFALRPQRHACCAPQLPQWLYAPRCSLIFSAQSLRKNRLAWAIRGSSAIARSRIALPGFLPSQSKSAFLDLFECPGR